MKKLLAICLLACAPLSAQQVPGATELPGSPVSIKKTWIVGGVGNWDYLTMDPVARQLFIAHGPVVQVIDVDSGTLAGQVTGLREAHAIALDESGELGYVSDGLAGQVKVFDRRTFQVVASIATGPSPRAIVIEPQSGVLFAICAYQGTGNPTTPQPSTSQANRTASAAARSAQRTATASSAADREIRSSVTVIDVQTRAPLGEILMPGRLGFAQADSRGQVFINIENRNQIARLDAQAIAALLRSQTSAATSTSPANSQSGPTQSGPATQPAAPPILDWSHESRLPNSAAGHLSILALGPECVDPRGLAVDSSHARLFAACNNMKMVVLNAVSGERVVSLPTGPGTDAVGFDPGRGLIYIANGGANGSLTVIRQDVTDTYAVIQDLPTRQRARTLAVNHSTGEVYLVTDLMGVNLAKPGGIGTLQTVHVNGSFQVLVIGN
jgi:DNA-binding beta-propeller fold protein YncE